MAEALREIVDARVRGRAASPCRGSSVEPGRAHRRARRRSRSTRSARSRRSTRRRLRARTSPRRRDERQHPHRALRRRLHRARWPPGPSDAPRRCWPASSASTARAATSWSRTPGCPPTSRPATCSRSPPPARTAGRWPDYNHVPRPPVVAVARRAGPGDRLRRETEDDLLAPRHRLSRGCVSPGCAGWSTRDVSRPDRVETPSVTRTARRCADGMTEARSDDRVRRPLQVALLGCGVVGAEVVRLLTSRPTTSPPGSARRWSWSASRCAARPRSRDRASTRRCSPPTPPPWSTATTSTSSSRSSAASSRPAR